MQLGTVGKVSCEIEISDQPWMLDIDAIVLSVGTSLGSLAADVRDASPRAGWRSVAYSRIKPDLPIVLPLGEFPTASSLRLAVLATPHDGGGSGPATLRSVGVATHAAIRTAADAGATAVGLPLLATGTLGFRLYDVAEVAIPAAVNALTEVGGTGLTRLVFLCLDADTATAVRSAFSAWVRSSGLEKPQGSSSVVPGLKSDRSRSKRSRPSPEPPPPPPPVFSDTELAGGVSSDLVDPNCGIPLVRDHLGVAPYVSMLATVIADRATPLPLSVGIFGEWGSGKSFFMGLLRHQVEDLTKSGNPTYCKHIEQIGFNAWHYADSNLWASLGDEIFRQLAAPGPDPEETRVKLRAELSGRLHERRQLEAATQQAEVEAAALQAKVDAATASRESGARDLIAALRESEATGKLLDGLWRRLGISNDVERGKLLAEQMRGGLTEAEALRRVPWDRRGKIALSAAAVLLATGMFVAVLAPGAKEWLAGLSGLVAVVAGAGIAALNVARSGLRKLRELTEDLHGGMEKAAREGIERDVADKLEALRRAEADQRVAEAQLTEVVSRVGELGRQLAELTPGRRLYTFLADRAHGDAYKGNLGLISVIRKDFEQLVTLMKEWREDGESATGKPVERIVLYIDDLDRCSPRQVVDVLQAVHLLLALELFVVVVGVDPRWLLRSLRSHYDEILESDGSADGGAADGWSVTPEDYLEKILNIPLVLPGMSSGSLNRLLRSMIEDGMVPGTAQPDGSARPLGSEMDAVQQVQTMDANVIPIEPGSEVDAVGRPAAAVQIPRPLTDPEIELLCALDSLVDTPREAKRLVNLYRMLRATRDLSEASRFLGDGERPGEYQAVVVLLGLLTAHARLLGRVLDSPPIPLQSVAGGLVHRSPDTPWASFVADFEPQRSDPGWTNGIVGAIPAGEVGQWSRLHRGLAQISAAVTQPDVSCFQLWVPRIRRFSYVLSPAASVGQPA